MPLPFIRSYYLGQGNTDDVIRYTFWPHILRSYYYSEMTSVLAVLLLLVKQKTLKPLRSWQAVDISVKSMPHHNRIVFYQCCDQRGVYDLLQWCECRVWQAGQQRIAVIESREDECSD